MSGITMGYLTSLNPSYQPSKEQADPLPIEFVSPENNLQRLAAGIRAEVVIDPGHGGDETGALGRKSGIYEKEINLQVSLLLKKELESRGIKVLLTREEDRQYIPGELRRDLLGRALLSQKVGASLFVSIHNDQIPGNSRTNGTRVFYSLNGALPEESEAIAQNIHDALFPALKMKPLGVEAADYLVIKANTVPAVLVELGFLTNASNERKLIDPAYQAKAAQSMAKTIHEWLIAKNRLP